MDPLTAVITIAGGVQTVFTFASALKTYIDSAKSAKEDVKKLAATIESVFLSIQELQDLLEQNESTGYWNDYGVIRAKKCIEDGFFIVVKLGKVLLKTGADLDENVAENINSSIFMPFIWPIYRSQVQELTTELMLLKLDVGTAHTTYRAQTWTADEEAKGRATLKIYQKSREIFLSQLKALKQERLAQEKEEGSDVDPREDRLGQAEQRIFGEWEEAVAERLRLEARLKDAEAAAAKQKEEQIRHDFAKQIKKDAAERLQELSNKRKEMEDLMKEQDIPPKDKSWIIESAIQTFHPVTQDTELVQALVQQSEPNKTRLPSTLELMGGGSNNVMQKSNHNGAKSKRDWSWRRVFGASSKASSIFDVDIPVLLQDPAAPGGRAVLYAAHFTPDPFGQYRSIEIEPLLLWAKCAQISKTSNEPTAEFMFLPENCKSAILNLLGDLCSASKNYTWNMLLVYQAHNRVRRNRFTGFKSRAMGEDSAGIFTLFKRHLRQHHGINASSTPQRDQNDLATRLEYPQINPYIDAQSQRSDNQSGEGERAQPADGEEKSRYQSFQRSRKQYGVNRPSKETEGGVDASPLNIELVEYNGEPMYRVPLRGLSFQDYHLDPSLRCFPDLSNPNDILILADLDSLTLADKVFTTLSNSGYDASMTIDVSCSDQVLQDKATILQQKKKEDTIKKRMMSGTYEDLHYGREYDDRGESTRWDRANANIYDPYTAPKPPIIPPPVQPRSSRVEAQGYGIPERRGRFEETELYRERDRFEDVDRFARRSRPSYRRDSFSHPDDYRDGYRLGDRTIVRDQFYRDDYYDKPSRPELRMRQLSRSRSRSRTRRHQDTTNRVEIIIPEHSGRREVIDYEERRKGEAYAERRDAARRVERRDAEQRSERRLLEERDERKREVERKKAAELVASIRADVRNDAEKRKKAYGLEEEAMNKLKQYTITMEERVLEKEQLAKIMAEANHKSATTERSIATEAESRTPDVADVMIGQWTAKSHNSVNRSSKDVEHAGSEKLQPSSREEGKTVSEGSKTKNDSKPATETVVIEAGSQTTETGRVPRGSPESDTVAGAGDTVQVPDDGSQNKEASQSTKEGEGQKRSKER